MCQVDAIYQDWHINTLKYFKLYWFKLSLQLQLYISDTYYSITLTLCISTSYNIQDYNANHLQHVQASLQVVRVSSQRTNLN